MRTSVPALLAVLLLGNSIRGQSAQDFLTEANQLIRSYEWQEALSLLNQATTKYPQDTELHLRYAYLLVRSGGAAKASNILREAALLHPRDSQILGAFGEARLALGDYPAAISLFQEAHRYDPADAQVLHGLALSLLLTGNKEGALAAAQEAARKAKPTPETRRLYSLLLNLDGRAEESNRQLKLAISEEPHNASLLFEMSETKRLDRKYGEALEYVDMAIEADPENPLYYSALARLYRQLKQNQPAADAQAEADRRLKAFRDYSQAVSLAAKGAVAKATQLLQPAVRDNPTFVTGKLFLADLETRQNHRERALQLYQEAISQDPTRLEAREKSAWIRTEQGDLDSALELLHGSPQFVQNQILTRAYLSMTRAEWADAISLLQQVELSWPLNHQLLKLMSTCFREQGKVDEALAYLDKARRVKPDDPEITLISTEIQVQQAMAFVEKRNWPAAIEAYQKLATSDPTSSQFILTLAYSRQRSGDQEGAVREYRRGLRLDRRALWARRNLANCLLQLRRFPEAATEWERVSAAERSSESLLQLGICYANLERNAEAEQVLEKALSKGNPSAELLYNAGITKMRLRKTEEGWGYVRRAGRKGYQPAQELLAKAARAAR